jgi:hypothetical protein
MFGYADVFYCKILMKARLGLMLNCKHKRRNGSSRRLPFTGSQRSLVSRIMFPVRKRMKQQNIYNAKTYAFVLLLKATGITLQWLQRYSPSNLSSYYFYSYLQFPRTTDNSIRPFNTILRVPINAGNLAFHTAADRSYRNQTPMYFRYPFTCFVVNFQTILEI